MSLVYSFFIDFRGETFPHPYYITVFNNCKLFFYRFQKLLGVAMYEIFEELIRQKGIKPSDVAKATGLRHALFTDWKMGRYTPKVDKLKLIADYLGVTVEYLMTGEETEQTYYFNDDARELAEFLFKNPDYKVLFDASRNVKREDIEFIRQMIERASR